jgi:hypothetical protein
LLFQHRRLRVWFAAAPDALESIDLSRQNLSDNRLFEDIKQLFQNAGAIKAHQKMDCQVNLLV